MLNVSNTFIENVKDPNKSKFCYIIINNGDLLFTNSDFTDGGVTIEEYFCTSEDLTYGDTPSPRLSFSVLGDGIPDGYSFFTSETGRSIVPVFGVEVAQAAYTFGDGVLAHIEMNVPNELPDGDEDETETTTYTIRVVEAKTDGLYYDGTKIDNGGYNTLLSGSDGVFFAIPQTPNENNPQYAYVVCEGDSTTITMKTLNQFMIRKFAKGASWSWVGDRVKVWADGMVTTYETIRGGWFDCEISNVTKDYIGNVYTFSDLPGIMSRADNVTYYTYTPEQVVAYLDENVSYPVTLKELCDILSFLTPVSLAVSTDAGVTQDIVDRFNSIEFNSNPFHGRSVSFRQILSWIGELTRTVANENRATGGSIIPRWLNGVSGEVDRWLWGAIETVSYSRISSSGISMAYRSTLETLRMVVEGVDGTVWDYEYSGSHPLQSKYSTYYIGGNPLITNFTMNSVNAYCDGLPTYTPCNFTVIYANPAVDVGDIIEAECVWANEYDENGDPVFDTILFPLMHRRMTFTGICFVAEYEASGGYQRQTNEFYDTQNRVTRNTNDIADIQESMSNYLTPETGVTSVNGSHGDVTVSDTKVTQTYASYSGYTYWRPLVVGSSAGSAETFTPSTVTNNVYTFSNIKVQPSTGTVKATTFKGNLTGTASGNLTSSSTLDPTKLSGVSSGTTKFLREDGSWETPAYPPDVSGSVTDILARLDNMKIATVTVPNGSTDVNFTSSTGTRGLLVCAGYSAGTKGVYIITCNTSGSVTYVTVTAGSNISFTTGTRKLTISNNSTASSVYAHFIFFAGGLA